MVITVSLLKKRERRERGEREEREREREEREREERMALRVMAVSVNTARAARSRPIQGKGSYRTLVSRPSVLLSTTTLTAPVGLGYARAARSLKSLNSGRISESNTRLYATGGEKSALYAALEDCEVFRVSDGAKVKLTDLWSSDERVLVAFGRHFG